MIGGSNLFGRLGFYFFLLSKNKIIRYSKYGTRDYIPHS